MPRVTLTLEKFLKDPQGRTFSDVVNSSELVFESVIEFFSDEKRQVRMEDSEIHHDRPPLAGVIRELEAHPIIDEFLEEAPAQRSMRLRQAVGVAVRIIMESRGWQKTGRKGSLGVRAEKDPSQPNHNTGGLAFWFLRAERYVRAEGMPFESVKERNKKLRSAVLQ